MREETYFLHFALRLCRAFLHVVCLMSLIVRGDINEVSDKCKNGGRFCDNVELAVSNMTTLMHDYTLVMDWAVEEDATKGNSVKEKFVQQLRLLDSMDTTTGSASANFAEQLLLSAVDNILRSRGNIIKDQMARNGATEVWPVDIKTSAPWVTSLLEQLLGSELLLTSRPKAMKAVERAALASVKLDQGDVVDLLLDHVATMWSQPMAVSDLANDLLPFAVTIHSWPLAGKLLALSCQSLSVTEQLNRLHTPSELLASHASTWHVADTMCLHFPKPVFAKPLDVPESCATCSVHRWLIARLVNLSIEADSYSSELVQERSKLYCDFMSSSDRTLPGLLPHQDDSPKQETKPPSGGWKRGSYLFGATASCDIPRYNMSNVTSETFRILSELSLPALLVNVEPLHGELRKLFSRKSAKKLFSEVDLLAGHIPYGEVFGRYGGMASGREMLEYLDSHWQKYAATARQWEKQGGRIGHEEEPPLYIFDSKVLQKTFNSTGSGLPYTLPDVWPDWRERLHQFVWGPPGSGAPVHYHCPAVNIMAFGRKRWTLHPPGEGHYSSVHPMHVRTGRSGSRERSEGLTCVQQPGEMLFVPSHWAHSTINIDQAIGIAVEFDLAFC